MERLIVVHSGASQKTTRYVQRLVQAKEDMKLGLEDEGSVLELFEAVRMLRHRLFLIGTSPVWRQLLVLAQLWPIATWARVLLQVPNHDGRSRTEPLRMYLSLPRTTRFFLASGADVLVCPLS